MVAIRSFGLLAAAVLAATLAGCSGENSSESLTTTETVLGDRTTSAATTTAPSAVPPTATSQAPTPTYNVVGEVTKRRDNVPTYYVVTDPVDLSSDAFKQDVQRVVQALAKTNGGPNFNAWVYDDEAVAATEFHYDTNPSDALQRSTDQMNADEAEEEQHLVAMYVGGWDQNTAKPSTATDAYNISWFPSASTDSPNVGQYVSWQEQWKP